MVYLPTHRAETRFNSLIDSSRSIRRIGAATILCTLLIHHIDSERDAFHPHVVEQSLDTRLKQLTSPRPELNTIASTLPGGGDLFPVNVRCGDLESTNAAGLVVVYSQELESIAPTHQVADTIYLDSSMVCDPLSEMVAHPSLTTDATPLAILLHEQQHVIGVTDESAAECRTIQQLPVSLKNIGHSRSGATLLAQDYANSIYHELPNQYQSIECSEGGLLDTDDPGSSTLFPKQLVDLL